MHLRRKCRVHDVLLGECRCPGPKETQYQDCPGPTCPGATSDDPVPARTSYPADGALPPGTCELDSQLYEDAMDELDQLRRWKREAMRILTDLDGLYDDLGHPGRLGTSKIASIRQMIARGIRGTVTDTGGGAVTITVDRGTLDYPDHTHGVWIPLP